jgi:simple sugar transport system substrate-binding protein
VNVASLGKIIPGWGQTEDFIAPWFATLEAKKNKGVLPPNTAAICG